MKAFLPGILAVLCLPSILMGKPGMSQGTEVMVENAKNPELKKRLSHTRIDQLRVSSSECLKQAKQEPFVGHKSELAKKLQDNINAKIIERSQSTPNLASLSNKTLINHKRATSTPNITVPPNSPS